MAIPPSSIVRMTRQLAEREAVLDGQNLVGPEHLLVALGSPDLVFGPTALGTFQLTQNQLRIAVHELFDRPMAETIGRPGTSTLFEQALVNAEVFATSEAQPIQHRHLVAGVLSINSDKVARVLTKLNTSAGAIQRVIGLGPVPTRSVASAPLGQASQSRGLVGRIDDLNQRVDQLTNLVERLLMSAK